MKISRTPTATVTVVLGLLLVASGLPANATLPTEEGQALPEVAARDSGLDPPYPADRKDRPRDGAADRTHALPVGLTGLAQAVKDKNRRKTAVPLEILFTKGPQATPLQTLAILAQGPTNISGIARKLDITPQQARRVLKHMVDHAVVEKETRKKPHTYRLTDTCIELEKFYSHSAVQVRVTLNIEIDPVGDETDKN